MGQTTSKPNPNANFQVIGAGLSRTGTASFGRALEILLNGPVYHGGTQVVGSSEFHIKSWINTVAHTPTQNESDRKIVDHWLREVFKGYVACTDYPGAQFTEELMQIYPDAKVICTIRDPDKWWASIDKLQKNVTMWHIRLILLPVPTMRHWMRYIDVTKVGRWKELYGLEGAARETWDIHIEWLKRVVPEEKLFFFSVKDGWEPLCKILDVEIPQGVPFPMENDAEALEGFIKAQIVRGLLIWTCLIGGLAVCLGIVWMVWR